MPLGDFVDVLLYRRGTPYWTHVCGWLRAAEEQPDDVLVLFFEDVVAHRDAAVRRVAAFLDVRDEAAISAAIERSSLEYMKDHATQFDEHWYVFQDSWKRKWQGKRLGFAPFNIRDLRRPPTQNSNRKRRDHIFGAVTRETSAHKVRDGAAGLGADELHEFRDEISEAVAEGLKAEHPRGVETYDALRRDAYANLKNVFRPPQEEQSGAQEEQSGADGKQ